MDHRALRHFKPKLGRKFIRTRAMYLLKHPLFGALTICGNGFMLAGAWVFYQWENSLNPKVSTFLDALWWSVQTVTTVGYGDISPVTTGGRIIGIGLMIFGTALFSAFTALFASILLAPEISEVEREVHDLERELEQRDRT